MTILVGSNLMEVVVMVVNGASDGSGCCSDGRGVG